MSKRENNYSAKLIIVMLFMFLGASFSPLVSANSNENIYVSGLIGEASKGLSYITNKSEATDQQIKIYLKPKARIDLGIRLRSIASSAIDVSDLSLIHI